MPPVSLRATPDGGKTLEADPGNAGVASDPSGEFLYSAAVSYRIAPDCIAV